jgi:signal transduction histidine kinase
VTAYLPGLVVLGVGCTVAGVLIAHGGVRLLGAGVATTGGLLLAAAAVPPWRQEMWVGALLVVLPVVLLLYPDGRPPPVVGWTAPGVLAVTGGLALVDPDRYVWSGVVPLASAVLVLAAVWWRHERAAERERLALLWLLLGAGVLLLLVLHVDFLVMGPVQALALGLACLPLPAALVVGAVRPGWGDVRGLMVRAVVLTVAALAFMAVFVGVVATAELLTGRTPAIGVLAVVGALCALGVGPLCALLRGAVDRMLFGDREAPVTAASRVGEQLSDDPVPALRALRVALAVPYTALERDGRVVAASGTAPAGLHRVPLRAGDRAAGELVVGLRPGASGLDAADETTLAIVAPALAQTVLARELARELQDSRAGMITAVEDERRRLRRDLHDGLGPTLTGVAFAADAARNVLDDDPARAAELVVGLRRDVADAIAEIRRLVEGLRPPALDELGLVGALAQQTRRHSADGRPLAVRLDVPRPLPALPAAVEVAAYRIVTEALTNVARHADSGTAVVSLEPDGDRLRIAVRDGGAAAAEWVAGVGLTSMRERAEQLGGTFRAGGGSVEVLLPVPAA